ncbi:MAG: hypothetical protein J6I80_02355, partial [Clostridia bacterium]|nr:hypothetical protein [Clostridia bacterium]
MTNLKKLAKRTIAVVIALTLLFSMCITAAVPATASTATVDVSSLTGVATASDDYVVNRVYKKLTDITGGGVNIAFTQYGGYEPYHYPVNMGTFDAIDLYFSNFASKNGSGSIYGNKKLLLLFANSSAGSDSRLANPNKFKPETVGILIDTIAGSLELVEQQTEQITSYTTYQTIVSNSVLKYDNFTGKDFKVSFNKNGTGLDVAVDVDGTVVSGTITAENLAKFKYCPTDAATYVSIGSVDSGASIFNNWSVNFYGYKKTYTEAENSQVAGGTIASLVSAISALPTTVTIDDAGAILSAQARYDSFGDAAKKRVTNAATLATAYAALLDVFNANEHEANATYYAAYPSVDNQFPNGSYRTLYS